MPTIGSHSFTSFLDKLRPAIQKVAVLETAPGVDGNAVVTSGWAQVPQTMPAVQTFSSKAAALYAQNAYRLLSGTVVNVVDQFGSAWPNVTILGVTSDLSDLGYGGLWRVQSQWLLLPQTTRPS